MPAYVSTRDCLARYKTHVTRPVNPSPQNSVDVAVAFNPCTILHEHGPLWMDLLRMVWFAMLVALPIAVARDLIQWSRVRRRMRTNEGEQA